MRRQRGFSLLEVVIGIAVFGIFLWAVTLMTADMRYYEKKYPVNFMAHPQVSAAISRLQRDVVDAIYPYYPAGIQGTAYTQTAKTLIIETKKPNGTAETVLWDFADPRTVRRRTFLAGTQTAEWVGRGLPAQFEIKTITFPGEPASVRIQARDAKGLLAIDQILQPRPHP